jgi:hypothetical protein
MTMSAHILWKHFYGMLISVLTCLILLVSSSATNVSAATQSVDIVLPENPAAPIKFGAEEIRQALEQRGLKVGLSHSASAKVRIYLGERGAKNLRGRNEGVDVPDKPESYVVAVNSRKAL